MYNLCIGVGGREIGFMYGQWKRLTAEHQGILTGKGYGWGGSLIRPEATGYGCVYALNECLKDRNDTMEGKKCLSELFIKPVEIFFKKLFDFQKVFLFSGSGNVAQYAAEKVLQLGGSVLSFSDSAGTLFCDSGFTKEDVQTVMELKNEKRGRLSELQGHERFSYHAGSKPWAIKDSGIDVALPCERS